MTLQRAHFRRGSVYVALLSITVIVTVIGVSALLAARLQYRAAEAANDAIEARFYANSAVDLALLWINSDPSWRSRYLSDVWGLELPLGRGLLACKLVDEEDGNLMNDALQPVRLYGRGRVGDAVRICSVLIRLETQPSDANLLANADMESGTANWTGGGFCDLESKSENPHGGAAELKVKNRSYTWAGPNQDVKGKLTSGTVYQTVVWVRMRDSTDNAKITLYLSSTGEGDRWLPTSWRSVGTSWTRIEGTIRPTWSGTLNKAQWYVETELDKKDFYIDDALLREYSAAGMGDTDTMVRVPGSWERQVLP